MSKNNRTIMKKTYINPTMKVVMIRTRQQMLTTSNPTLGSSYQSGETVLGRDFDFDFDDDEE